jgi:trans-aconitate methyltransferase
MGAYASAKGMEPHHLLDNYDWNAVKLAVDVGGAGGHISNMLALEYPHLQLVVQDLPKVVMAAKKGSPPEVAARVKIMAHDFFDPQPIKDADVYLFRLVFHNWSDKFCLEILRALIPALKYGACVLVQDYCLPEPNTIPFWKEKKLRYLPFSRPDSQSGGI